jgi:diguanylate cyclase (GGDEF)-like protein
MNICALLPILLGCTALMGWALNNPLLESSFLQHGIMNPMSAGCMILTGLTLISFTPGLRKLHVLGWAGGFIVFVLSLFRLSDYILHTGFAFDKLLFPGQMTDPGQHASHMSPNAAVCFFLLSIAIMLHAASPRFKGWRGDLIIGAAQAIAVAVSFMTMLAMIGYVYDTYSFYSFGSFTPMAMNTALCVLLLCFGLLQLCRHDGLMKYIVNDGPGGRMARLLLPASVIVPLIMGWTRLLGMRAGFYDAEFGVSVTVIFNFLTWVILTWVGAWMLFKTDRRRRESEELLRYQATHDSLTGLSNRAVFTEHLQRRLNLAQRKPHVPFAVFYMDLDGFKQVNDQLGHAAGDQLLKEAAEILRHATRTSDTAARFGGDEFTILFEEVTSGNDVTILAKRILESMPRSITMDGKTVNIGVSIGIAVYDARHKAADDILREADIALYRAKSKGKGCFELAQAA